VKFMTPRQVIKDQHSLKEKIENKRTEKEVIKTEEGRKIKKKKRK